MGTKLRESLEKAFQEHDAKVEEPASTQEASSEPESQDNQNEAPPERAATTSDSKDVAPPKAVSGDESNEDIKKLSADSKGEKPDAPSSKEPQQTTPPPSEIPQDVPPFWKAEDKAVWAKVPPEVRQIVRKYEDGRNAAVTRFKQIINEKIGQWSDVSWDALFPKERIRALQIEGKTPAAATASLWAWNDYLEENPAAAILELMNEYGLTPEQVHHYQSNGVPVQAPPPTDPRVDKLIADQQQQTEQQQVSLIKQQLDAFGGERNAQGAPLRPHWNEVKAYIKQILPVVYSENPDITDYEALHSAYERAVYANPQVRTKLVNTNNNQVKFSDEKTQRAKEAASASLTGSSSRTAEQPKTARTARDALGMAWAEHSR